MPMPNHSHETIDGLRASLAGRGIFLGSDEAVGDYLDDMVRFHKALKKIDDRMRQKDPAWGRRRMDGPYRPKKKP